MDMQNDTGRDQAGQGKDAISDGALDALAVAPPPAADDQDGSADEGSHGLTKVRDGMDSADVRGLGRNPSDENLKLEVALDETFPGSDAPSNTQPGKGKDPAPSSGYDPEAEKARARGD